MRASPMLLSGLLVSVAVAAASPSAAAQTASAEIASAQTAVSIPFESPGQRLPRLRAVLEHVDAQAPDAHVPALIAGLAIGAVAIPTGIVMLGRDGDANTIGGSVVLGTGIGSALGGIIQLFVPLGATMQLDRQLESAIARGASPDQAVAAIEQEWAQRAYDVRMGRKISGGITMVVGTLAVGGGAVVALTEPDALSSTDQAVLSSVLIGAGALVLVGGVQVYLTETPEEVAWNTYAASNGISTQPIVVAPRLGLAPVPGGAAVSFGGHF